MIKIIWPEFTGSQTDRCFDKWYENLYDREIQYEGDYPYARILNKNLEPAGATVQSRGIFFEITFGKDSDLTFFLLKWS
jgi:hypothetical protein